jgi:isopentenyl phosphate kinase
MIKNLTLVKLGGSLINNKTRPYTVKNKIINRLASEIKTVIDKDACLDLLIGYGAGSFGHYPVYLYGLPRKITSLPRKYGVCVTAYGVTLQKRGNLTKALLGKPVVGTIIS